MNENVNISGTSGEANISSRNSERTLPKRYFVQRCLSFAFRRLGASCGRYPWFYFLVPIFVSLAFSIRIYWITLTTEVEYLYVPINSRAIKEREAIESIFPPTTGGMSIINLMRFRKMATLLMEAKDGGSILREEILRELSHINSIVYNITVFQRGKNYRYTDLCSKQLSGHCQSNDVLNLIGRTEDIRKKRLRVKFPFYVDTYTVGVGTVGLGGVTTDEDDYIVDAKAARLVYILDDTTDEKDATGKEWELSFQKVLLNLEFRTVRVSMATAQSIDIEFSRVTEMALPLLPVTAFIMSMFALVSCLTTEWVTSKPWVAIAGCVSPVLAVAAAFGFLLLCRFEYADLNVIILFLLVGIGLDDSFVMLAAWRRTDPRKEVIARMSQTYEEAAMSITITSITNILSLSIGIIIPYRIVQIYCRYAAISVAFAYIYQTTFFGGALALSGYREKNRRHPFLCLTVKEEHVPKSLPLKLLYFGYKKIGSEGGMMRKYSSTFSDSFLMSVTSSWGKRVVVTVFLVYLAISAYSLRFLKEKFDYRDAMPYHSYLVDYFNMHQKYFTEYPHVVHVAINTTLDYSSKEVQRDIDDMMDNVCSVPGLQKKIVISWLKYFMQSAEESLLRLSYRGYNFSKPEDFISVLKSVFLKLPHSSFFRPLIKFNDNGTQIVASRFIVLSNEIGTYEKEKTLVRDALKVADSLKYPVYIFNIWFPLYSIFLKIRSSTIEAICTAAATVAAVFLIFIPDPLCFAGTVLTVISIQIGVLGYMSLWGVVLNPVSMICLILSVGLSVDYAAHICYAYLSCKNEDPNEKTRTALRHAGYPIIQGCLSTILGVVVLGFGPSNVFIVFCKVVTLVMLIAAFHGLLVIPVMLNVLESKWWRRHHESDSPENSHKSLDNDYTKMERLYSSTEEDENVKSVSI